MEKFINQKLLVAPLDRSNVDTDMIIPKQFLKSIKRSGFGVNLFDEWRYLDQGEPGQDCSSRPLNEDFVLNQKRYQGAGLLITRQNFGCGSSREHAPWALLEYGFKVIIASSFADIFYNNCFKNGILPVVLTEQEIDTIFSALEGELGYALDIDLESQKIYDSAGTSYSFEVDAFRKYCLLNGLDDIGLSLKDSEAIKSFEAKQRKQSPWLYNAMS